MTDTVVPLSVSVNGRDFEAVPGGFTYYTPPAASAVSPAVGPAAGSTSLVVTGYAIGAAYGTQLECMLGGLVVEATRLNHSAVRCTSPNATALLEAAGGAVARSVPLQLSLNGQLFTPAAQLSYLLQLPHNVTRFVPVSGPSDGGTTVALAGRALAGGADYRCRFGYHRVVPASYDAYSDTLSCVAPPHAAQRAALYAAVDAAPPPLATPLEVTLNGQQYTSDELPFTQYAPLRFLRLDPPSGGALGGTAVLVHFNASGQAKPFEALLCRFGSAPPTRPEQHASDWAICRTPAAHVAGARALLHRLDFEGELAAPVLAATEPSNSTPSPNPNPNPTLTRCSRPLSRR